MKFTFFCLLLISITGTASAQSGIGATDSAKLQKYVEYNDKNVSITSADGVTSFKSLRDLDDELNEGIALYKANKYAEAYTIFSELSQWGVKEAQAVLGGMFIEGHYVDRSTEKGLAWLGVAKEVSTQRSASKMFKHVYKQLNSEQQKYIDQMVDSYIAKYGVEAQNYSCSRRTYAGSNIPETNCKKLPNSNSTLYPIG
jgi:hypothetical protein